MSETRDFTLVINTEFGCDASGMHCSLDKARRVCRDMSRARGTRSVKVLDPEGGCWFSYAAGRRRREGENANPESASAVSDWLS